MNEKKFELKRNIFEPRLEIKPYEYPELLEFKDAIRHSYWLHTEFNFTSDIQDFKTVINSSEREIITRTMLAISQIEVAVKKFWGTIDNYFPKPEIGDVGGTFLESEVRHKDAYSFLLEKLGLNDLFKNVKNIPALMARIEYMQKFMKNKDDGKEEFTLSLILFSLFIEHISLFSQFLIMMSFNKHRNLFKGISNAVEATSKEEEIHGKFGIALYEILRKEHPEIFVKEKDFFGKLKEMANEAFKAEEGIVDWIFEGGELDFLPKEVVMNYIKSRYNNSLEILGIEKPFKIDEKMLEQTKWFDDEILATKETDFFNKRSTDYSKKMEPITPADLF